MAAPTTQTTPKASGKVTPPTPPAAPVTPPAAPVTAAQTVTTPEVATTPEKKKPGRKGVQQQIEYPTIEAAMEAAAVREKGARRAFTVKGPGGKAIHGVFHSEHHAVYHYGTTYAGISLEKPGSVRKVRAASPTAILESLNSLPEADRAAVLAELKALMSKA